MNLQRLDRNAQTRQQQLTQLAELSTAFFAEEGRHRFSLEQVLAELQRLTDDVFDVLMHQRNGSITAFCLYRVEQERVFIKRLYTAPDARRQGLASALLNQLQEHQRPLSVYVAPDNAQAIAFYERLGGRESFRAYDIPLKSAQP